MVKRKKKKCDYKKIRVLNNNKGTSITELPKAADERTEKWHWEIDLVAGQKGTKTAVPTLVERKSL